MRRILEDVVTPIGDSQLDLAYLVANGDQGVAEPVELRFRLAFRGLDHECPGNRERHCRRVESIVHEPLRDVLDVHA